MKDSVEQRQVEGSANKQITDWENEPTVSDLKADFLIAQPSHDLQVSKIQHWRELRDATKSVKTEEDNGKKKAVPNRSTVQPKLVRRNNEWRYAPLSEPFLSSERLFAVSGRTFEDSASARQNELVLNWQMKSKMNSVAFIDNYVRTVVDDGTVIVRPGWRREKRKVTVEKPEFAYEIQQDPEFLQVLQQAIELKTANPQAFSLLADDLKESAEVSIESGQPTMARIVGMIEVEEEEIYRNHPTLEILDYENVYLDPNGKGDISRCNFAIISFETSRAKLQADGRYVNLDMVNWAAHTPLADAHHTHLADHTQFKDEARKVVVAYEYWGFYDIYKTGDLIPIVATWVGDTMIRMEENPFPTKSIPLVVVPYMPVRNSAAGEPDAELLEDNQLIQGALVRGMIDLLGKSANSQTGIAKGMLDPLNKRRFENGQDYEYNPNQHPSQGVFQHKFPELPASAIQLLNMQSQEAEALTGVKAFAGGLAGNAYGDVAAGIRGMLDAASKREMSILRRLAQGMEEIGRMILAMNAAFLSEEEVVQVTNTEYVRITREDLIGEHDLQVDISTAEIDQAKAQDLGFMLQTLGNTIPFDITKGILAEIARLKRMPELAHQIMNYQPQPDPIKAKRDELELAKLEAEIAEEHARAALAQAKTQETMARARAIGSKADLDDLNFIEQETGTKHARDIDKLGVQARGNQQLEITKRLLDPKDGESQKADVGQALLLSHALQK